MLKLNICFTLLIFFSMYFCQKTQKLCENTKSILFKESDESHRMIEIVFSNQTIDDCFIYGDKNLAQKTISKKLCQPKVSYVSKQLLSEWALKCSEWLSQRMTKGIIDKYTDEDFPDEYNNKIDRNFFEGIMIFPGTKWCGAGDIAEHHDDLGEELETDQCCRAHDLCFDQIPSGETKYDLKNSAIHTKSQCECDNKFKTCLQSVDKSVSQKIAKLFFSLIQIQCFKKDYPIIKCLEYKGIPFFWESCQKYSLDYSKQTIYQFFDAIFFNY